MRNLMVDSDTNPIRLTHFRHGPLTLVEYEDGQFAVEREGVPMPACRFAPADLEHAVQAFRRHELEMVRAFDWKRVG